METVVTAPDGTEITVVHPEGATDEQILRFAKQQYEASPSFSGAEPSSNVSPGFRGFLEGVGQGFANVGRGLGQINALVNPGVLTRRQAAQAFGVAPEDIQRARERDADLLGTGRGAAGSITGTLAASLPAALLPGANSVLGASAIGAGIGAAQPVVSPSERGINTLAGGALGGAGQAVGGQLSRLAASRLAARSAARSADRVARQPIRELVEEGAQAGFAVPPATSNPTLLNRSIEGLAGKTRVGQSASVVNQRVSNDLAKQAIGIPDNVPLSKATVQGIRQEAGKLYDLIENTGDVVSDDTYRQALQALKGVRASVAKEFPNLKIAGADEIDDIIRGLDEQVFSAKSAVDLIKQFRRDATVLFAASDDPTKLALARANRGAADALDDLLARNLANKGLPDLAGQYNQARQTIAKAHTVEAALNEAGNINPRILANQLNKGAPLSDGLGLTARMADAFPSAMRSTTESFQTFSPLDFIAFGGGTGVGAMGAGPAGLGIAAIPLLRMGLTRGLVSAPGQRLAAPSVASGHIGDSGLTLLDIIGRRAGIGAASVNAAQQ